jgi:hypothetical protein
MTDERIDALVRRLDVSSEPDSAFVESSLVALIPAAAHARRRDGQWLGRTRTRVRLAIVDLRGALAKPSMRPVALVVVLLMLLALFVALAGIGNRRPAPTGAEGPLIVSRAGELLAINVGTSTATTILRAETSIAGVSRSPDGRLVTFWTGVPGGNQLEIANVDGTDQRRLAAGLTLSWTGCIDVWTADSRHLAAQVRESGRPAILVVDVATGTASLLRPPDGTPECPLWSPDGLSIAFRNTSGGSRSLEVVGADGTGWRSIAGGADGLSVAGANSWSPDGVWIYFDAAQGGGNGIFRADARTGALERLTDEALRAYAPALSPDGSLVSFMAAAAGRPGAYDLYLMKADGSELRLVLSGAINDGWSGDGRWMLAEWQPPGGTSNGGLVIIAPEGGSPTTVLSFESPCSLIGTTRCLDGVGWGQPRP